MKNNLTEAKSKFDLIMKRFIVLAAFSVVTIYLATKPKHLMAQPLSPNYKYDTVKPFSLPLQLEVRVPFEPTAFPSSQNSYLFYELYLTNFGSSPVKLESIEVVDAGKNDAGPIALFNEEQLNTMIRHTGESTSDTFEKLTIKEGKSAIIFMQVTVNSKSLLPGSIFHRIHTGNETINCAVIKTRKTNLQLFGPPLKGKNWLAADAPSNDEDNHHRRGVIIFDGRAIDSRRYAIDWKKVKDGASFSGDSRNVQSYLCYGEPVFAVADGRVIKTINNLPDNIPGHGEAFHPAVPITFETIGGNSVIIDLGNSHFAYYLHLQPGSLRVKVGDRVKKGQLLARIGASGDAREPHLHFEVTTSPTLLLGEGVPYIIDRYRLSLSKDGLTNIHIHELPLNGEIVDFEEQVTEH